MEQILADIVLSPPTLPGATRNPDSDLAFSQNHMLYSSAGHSGDANNRSQMNNMGSSTVMLRSSTIG